jgi:hypothetical protein
LEQSGTPGYSAFFATSLPLIGLAYFRRSLSFFLQWPKHSKKESPSSQRSHCPNSPPTSFSSFDFLFSHPIHPSSYVSFIPFLDFLIQANDRGNKTWEYANGGRGMDWSRVERGMMIN